MHSSANFRRDIHPHTPAGGCPDGGQCWKLKFVANFGDTLR